MKSTVPGIEIDDVLIVNPQLDLEGAVHSRIEAAIQRRIDEGTLRGLILDLSAIPVIDVTTCRSITGLAQRTKLLGADVFVVGVRAPVAASLVMQGGSFGDVETARDVDQALDRMRQFDRSALQ